MKAAGFIALLALAGCASKDPLRAPTAQDLAPEPTQAAKPAGGPGAAASPRSGTAPREARPEPAKRAPAGQSATAAPIDPAVLGDYRLRLSAEQQSQIDRALARMKADAAKGDRQAADALAFAQAAKEMATRMSLTLKRNGRYEADFGSGKSAGVFQTHGESVLLRPDTQPDPRDNLPPDMEMKFDRKAKTLTVDYQGNLMVFERA